MNPDNARTFSRRSLGRVSVPMWGIPLSGPLPIVATVGRCPAVKLIGRIPIPFRQKPFVAFRGRRATASGINPHFYGLCRGKGQVGYALLTRAPVAGGECKHSPRCPATCMC